ncbi:hypothetical protein HPP92_028655, partial [Vanilla planifolia]
TALGKACMRECKGAQAGSRLAAFIRGYVRDKRDASGTPARRDICIATKVQTRRYGCVKIYA